MLGGSSHGLWVRNPAIPMQPQTQQANGDAVRSQTTGPGAPFCFQPVMTKEEDDFRSRRPQKLQAQQVIAKEMGHVSRFPFAG